MQLKPITAIAVLIMIVSLNVVGCTSSSSSNTPTPGLFGTSLAADNLAGAITDLYTEKGYTVNTPFTMTKQGDTITYHGVVTDGLQQLAPYKRDVTIVLERDRASAFATYRAAVNTQKERGYVEDMSSNSSTVNWVGYLGMKFPPANESTPRVRVDLYAPWPYGLNLAAPYNELLLDRADVSNYYQVITDQQTLAT